MVPFPARWEMSLQPDCTDNADSSGLPGAPGLPALPVTSLQGFNLDIKTTEFYLTHYHFASEGNQLAVNQELGERV